MSNTNQILELLPKVKHEIGGIGKDSFNSYHKYKFRGIDDVLNVVGPALDKHCVVTHIEVTDHKLQRVDTQKGFRVECSLTLMVFFHAPDGSVIASTGVGEAHDTNGDKATNKAMSAAYKYAVLLGLCIPVDPASLADSDHGEEGYPSATKESVVQPQERWNPPAEHPAPEPPAAPAEPKPLTKADTERPATNGFATPEQFSEFINVSNDAYGTMALEKRKEILAGQDVTKFSELKEYQAREIIDHIKAIHDAEKVF